MSRGCSGWSIRLVHLTPWVHPGPPDSQGPPRSTWLLGSTQVHLTSRPYIRQSANGQEGRWRERGSNWSKYKKFWMFSRLQIYTCESMHHAAYLCRCRNIQVCRSVMWKYESASVKVYNLKIKVCKRKCASMHCMCTCMQMCKYASMQVCRWRAQPKVPRREDPVRAGWISPPHNPTLTFKIQNSIRFWQSRSACVFVRVMKTSDCFLFACLSVALHYMVVCFDLYVIKVCLL